MANSTNLMKPMTTPTCGSFLCSGMATPKKTASTKSDSKPAPAAKTEAAPKASAPKPAAAAPAKKPTQLDLMLAAQAKKRAEGKSDKAAPSAKALGAGKGGIHGHMNTNAKGGAVGVARRTAPGA